MDISAEFIAEAKQKLEQKLKKLILEKKHLLSQDSFVEESSDPVGRNLDEYVDEAMEQIQHSETTKKVLELDAEILQIKKALNRIESGVYGLDEYTNKPIDIARLKAYPEATTAN